MYCRYIRWRLEQAAETGSSLPARAAEHLKQCRRCQIYYEDLCSVISHLRRHKPEMPIFCKTALQERILSDILKESHPAQKQEGLHRMLRTVCKAALAALVILGISWLLSNPNSPSLPSEENPLNRAITADFYDFHEQLLKNTLSRPYETEIDNLNQDMKTAIRFVSACLPHTVIPAELP